VLGFEGVVAKKGILPYRAGERWMVKVKHFETCDVIVGGYTGVLGEPRALILGLYDSDGCLHHVGTTSLLPGATRALARELRPAENPFTGLQPGRTRWQSHRYEQWVPVEPTIACEISFSRFDGMRFRHSVKFVRWRPDRSFALLVRTACPIQFRTVGPYLEYVQVQRSICRVQASSIFEGIGVQTFLSYGYRRSSIKQGGKQQRERL
jgi:ATP-dependent DNA ligase